mmetsp:Transcript_17040/g.49608  ORF Transcript_17040/g.49608 Transcript_17040/m.49608 type:complete len:136 (-) Transcript_17040:885-1292(-)
MVDNVVVEAQQWIHNATLGAEAREVWRCAMSVELSTNLASPNRGQLGGWWRGRGALTWRSQSRDRPDSWGSRVLGRHRSSASFPVLSVGQARAWLWLDLSSYSYFQCGGGILFAEPTIMQGCLLAVPSLVRRGLV